MPKESDPNAKIANVLYNAVRRGVSGVLEVATMINLGDPDLSGDTATDATFDEICFFHLISIPLDVRGRIPDNEVAELHEKLHQRLSQSLSVALAGVEKYKSTQKSADEEADDEVWKSVNGEANESDDWEDFTNTKTRGDA